jgi:hypothetical protein
MSADQEAVLAASVEYLARLFLDLAVDLEHTLSTNIAVLYLHNVPAIF